MELVEEAGNIKSGLHFRSTVKIKFIAPEYLVKIISIIENVYNDLITEQCKFFNT